jgi:hypothetical protein
MRSDNQIVDRKKQVIFFTAVGLVLAAAIVSAIFQDWWLAGLSVTVGLLFTVACWLSKININPIWCEFNDFGMV